GGNDLVVERGLGVGDAVGDGLALAATGAAAARLRLGHSLVLPYLLLAGHRLLRALAGAGVGVGALTVDGETPAVPDSLVTVDLDLALDVLGDVSAQVTLDLEVLVDVGAQAGH